MFKIDSCKGVLIVGYGISGKSAYKFLTQKGLKVFVLDDFDHDVPNKFNDTLKDIDLVVKSPAIPIMEHNCHDVVKRAIADNIPVISMLDLFKICNPMAKIIAITGTNGKSTTTALTYHILKKAGVSVQIGGNIGTPYFDLESAEWYVLELSSYELASSRYLDFEISCVLNIEPDHLEFHGEFLNYVKAKHSVLENAKLRLVSYEDQHTMEKYRNATNVVTISTENNGDANIFVRENVLFESRKLILDLSCILHLRGRHNYQNMEFAYAICKRLGVTSKEVFRGIQSFHPLPHRMNTVRKINNVLFVNDSKATNPSSAAHALATFIGYKIYWLVGGRSKKVNPIAYVANCISDVKKIYLYGEAADEFAVIFEEKKDVVKCKVLAQALMLAYKDAAKESGPTVVLFSPMCSSFDQFKSFE
ncbi:MAG: UDP-N-acetylmuramoyl-L-alanine--D-glutamate ligase, partial [Holosporales bacterium]|nr:UDP-N-acetylmuramoyl-L-alanine--D-glutamate ligase [Holosporales bacterium]